MPKTKKLHKFELKSRAANANKPMTGASTMLYMDGKPMKGVTKAKLEVSARGLAKLTLEVLGTFGVSGMIGKYEQVIVPLKGK